MYAAEGWELNLAHGKYQNKTFNPDQLICHVLRLHWANVCKNEQHYKKTTRTCCFRQFNSGCNSILQSTVSNGIWNSASKPIQKKEQTACMSYCLIVFTTKEARTLFFFFNHLVISLIHSQTDRAGCKSVWESATYTATGENLRKKRDRVVFVSELVSYKVIHLWDTNTKQAWDQRNAKNQSINAIFHPTNVYFYTDLKFLLAFFILWTTFVFNFFFDKFNFRVLCIILWTWKKNLPVKKLLKDNYHQCNITSTCAVSMVHCVCDGGYSLWVW